MTIRNQIADFTKDILTDKELMTGKVKEQITKALERNQYLTSCYSLQVTEVQDIKGRDSKTSGWYFILEGTRSGVKFFLNNDMEITRKPVKDKVEVVASYSLYNHNNFWEDFWQTNF